MVQKNNTGNYRVCRHKPGIGDSIEILMTGEKAAVNQYWQQLQKDAEYTYYREEEVYYSGTTFDENGNPMDTAPNFQRI